MAGYKLKLRPKLHQAPVYWQNFVSETIGQPDATDQSHLVHKALAEIGCKLTHPVTRDVDIYCTFPSEEDFIMFKLRWS